MTPSRAIPRARRPMWPCFAAALSVCTSVATHAAPPLSAEAPSTNAPSTELAPETVAEQHGVQSPPEDDPMKTFRAPLLREGSTLVEAYAKLKREGPQNWWTLTVDGDLDATSSAATTATPPHELIVLPCTRLTEMLRIIDSAAARSGSTNDGDGDDVRFKVSGRVYVFRDRNYLLPTHAVVVSEVSTRPKTPAVTTTPVAPASAPTTTSADAPAATPLGVAGDDDSAEAIARALEQAAGPLSRSSAAATEARTPPVRGTQTQPTGSRAQPGSTTRGASTTSAAITMQENTAIVNRRGKITRDRSGGWLLVFDADANGISDPPVKLLPCLLLESIETYARRVGNNSPVIITGQVYLYDGQVHLLPTVYRIPRERSRLTP